MIERKYVILENLTSPAKAQSEVEEQIRANEREHCAKVAEEWSKADALLLAVGEMTAQELRTALAVVKGTAARIRNGPRE